LPRADDAPVSRLHLLQLRMSAGAERYRAFVLTSAK
jgi:hypothetical protein